VLVNWFAFPYTDAATAAANQGVVVSPNAITGAEIVERASVARTYERILEDIASAKTHFAAGDAWVTGTPSTGKFYMNLAAIYALEARVHLYMKNWAAAATAAQEAITRSGGSIQMDPTTYVSMWGESTSTVEDIFTINIDVNTMLTANSPATFYNSYGGSVNPTSKATYWQPGDMRLGLMVLHDDPGNDPTMWRPMKFPNTNSINNIPVFRIPEMYLILAEANNELATPNTAAAQAALFQVARRNPAITSVADLPSTQVALRQFIKEERIRELFQEGHRFWDIRRNGDLMTRPVGETKLNISNWNAALYCFPIPDGELAAPGTRVVQTVGWNANLPN
jgi:hypothetical protein